MEKHGATGKIARIVGGPDSLTSKTLIEAIREIVRPLPKATGLEVLNKTFDYISKAMNEQVETPDVVEATLSKIRAKLFDGFEQKSVATACALAPLPKLEKTQLIPPSIISMLPQLTTTATVAKKSDPYIQPFIDFAKDMAVRMAPTFSMYGIVRFSSFLAVTVCIRNTDMLGNIPSEKGTPTIKWQSGGTVGDTAIPTFNKMNADMALFYSNKLFEAVNKIGDAVFFTYYLHILPGTKFRFWTTARTPGKTRPTQTSEAKLEMADNIAGYILLYEGPSVPKQ